MKTFAALLATGVCLMTAPVFAGASATPDQPITLAGARFCIGPGCADRDDDWRWRHRYGYGWDRGCRDVTIRERRDGEVIVRHIRRCD